MLRTILWTGSQNENVVVSALSSSPSSFKRFSSQLKMCDKRKRFLIVADAMRHKELLTSMVVVFHNGLTLNSGCVRATVRQCDTKREMYNRRCECIRSRTHALTASVQLEIYCMRMANGIAVHVGVVATHSVHYVDGQIVRQHSLLKWGSHKKIRLGSNAVLSRDAASLSIAWPAERSFFHGGLTFNSMHWHWSYRQTFRKWVKLSTFHAC